MWNDLRAVNKLKKNSVPQIRPSFTKGAKAKLSKFNLLLTGQLFCFYAGDDCETHIAVERAGV